MQIFLEQIVIQLSERKRLVFSDARNINLECTEGLVWITIEGQQGDFILKKGERLCIESNGLAVIQGIPSGSIQMHCPATVPLHQKGRPSFFFS
jgi:hypothetical protein